MDSIKLSERVSRSELDVLWGPHRGDSPRDTHEALACKSRERDASAAWQFYERPRHAPSTAHGVYDRRPGAAQQSRTTQRPRCLKDFVSL
ncbi:hypothetical protein EVAR_66952_1 [Eumeta japonica]|uniref:Uncharacterized protein n=1 Tax=Eumeta variegata TaxID=151549 RepID=A0A4C1ZU93_EUMVA|nr:hypothetical protein EVAR_66952_1 [Eumeta japonica]